jgi:hypothetical protein
MTAARRLQQQLTTAGMTADVHGYRKTQITVRFSGKQTGTDSAKVWARRILAAVPNLRIVDTHDSVADWLPGCPIVYALVIVEFQAAKEAA